MNTRFDPARGLSGTLRPPADKSISHRAALIGAMASEPVRIERYLHAADTSSTLQAIRTLGALVEVHGHEVVVRGTGLREAREPDGPIDVGNAGTLLRLLPGWLAAQEGSTFTLDGDDSIRRRPVDRCHHGGRALSQPRPYRADAPARRRGHPSQRPSRHGRQRR
jgi:3-phosphoshikimate 1-carboxyvinyltransferase